MRIDKLWRLKKGSSPIVATAIHHGHELRDEVAALMKLDEQVRLREEDPYTGEWTTVSDNALVVERSRFEVDLNRPRDRAVYIEPNDAWGLELWRSALPEELVKRSLSQYDRFYSDVQKLFKDLERRFGHFIVFDIHSYNHRRDGDTAPPEDPTKNPEVNIGTGTLDRKRWGPMVDRFMADLAAFDFIGRKLDVRENIKFFGGHLSRWTHQQFPNSACVLAIEFKKFFMDEWTGAPDHKTIGLLREALKTTVPGVLEELEKL